MRTGLLVIQFIEHGQLKVNMKSGLVLQLLKALIEKGVFDVNIWNDAKYKHLTITRRVTCTCSVLNVTIHHHHPPPSPTVTTTTTTSTTTSTTTNALLTNAPPLPTQASTHAVDVAHAAQPAGYVYRDGGRDAFYLRGLPGHPAFGRQSSPARRQRAIPLADQHLHA